MLILHFTDIHLNHRKKDPLGIILEEGINSRLQEKINFYRWLRKLVNDLRPDLIIDNGDVFDPRTAALPTSLRETYINECVLPLAKTEIPFRIIGTNHGSDGEFHAISSEMEIFKHFSSTVRFVRTPKREIINGLEFWYIPYGMTVPDSIYKSKEAIIFGHFTVKGIYPDPHPIELDTKRIRKAVLGHIHNRIEQGRILYPGAVFPNDFAEAQLRETSPYVYCSLFEVTEDSIEETILEFKDVIRAQYFRVYDEQEIHRLPIQKDNIIKITIVKPTNDFLPKSEIRELIPVRIRELYINLIVQTEDIEPPESHSTTFLQPDKILSTYIPLAGAANLGIEKVNALWQLSKGFLEKAQERAYRGEL